MDRMARFALVTALAIWAGCSDESKPQSADRAQPTVEPAFDDRPQSVPADQPGVEGEMRAHLNLQNLAHLADVDQGGLFIDFGTPARMKYTVGHWKTGWGKDGVEGETTYTNVASTTGRIYLPLPRTALTLKVRAKAIGTGTMQLYVNNQQLPVVRLDKSAGFQVYEVPIPEDAVVAGENYILMRMGDTVKLGSENVSVAIDYIHAVPSAPVAAAEPTKPEAAQPTPAPGAAGPAERTLPRYGELVAEVAAGGSRRKALSLAAPGTLSYYVDVPKEGKLSFRVAAADGGKGLTARVRVTPEGGAPSDLFQEAVEQSWKQGVVSLAPWAGKLVRLELEGQGEGRIAWSSPSILIPDAEAKPHDPAKSVVVLLIDTLRASKLQVYNPNSRVKTPVLDEFAKQGTVFDAAQSPENWTKPSVASVLTGLYPMTHQTKKSESSLPQDALMVSEVFKQNGFSTASFLANGYVSNKFGFDQGWDHYTNYIREKKSTEAENVFREAGDWIEKHKDERFFVYIQTIDPHVPYDPPKEFLDMYDPGEYTGQVTRRGTPDLLEKAKRNPPKAVLTARDRKRLEALHDAEISYHDKYMGRFVERLRKLGLYDNVLFVVTSDHGEEFYEHGSYGHGHSVYQEMIHVPLMYRWPGVVPAGVRQPQTVGTLDIAPTVLSAAGIKVPEVMEGLDRMGHIRGVPPAGPAVGFSDFLDDRRVIRAGRWKLILRGLNITLFDLEKDPGEQTEPTHAEHPIAMRYCRVMLGQFLGAKDRGDWLAADAKGASVNLRKQDTEIDEQTREGLKALGYAN